MVDINRGETRGKGMHPVSGPNPTQQSQLPETDINMMSAKYLKSRMAGNPNGRKPMFIEVPSASFHEMMNTVMRMRDDFSRLSAKVRAKFMNDPGVMLAWLENPDNRREGVRMGLIDDPELAYNMEQERLRKTALKVEQTDSVPRADPEAQPGYKGSKDPKTP